MANSYRTASGRRKLVYFGVIVVLFVVTLFGRGVVAMPLSGVRERADHWSIQGQSDRLELTEMSRGDVELTDSAVRLLLTGSRGLAVCGLWISAAEEQKRQEWNALELRVRSITMLQPHFVTPWLFQSWNLSYNVSVEMDNLNDMYFYIARGISLLAEGESINRNNPDMRYTTAFYYQNKFSYSDKVTTLRCLFNLSCLPKEERDYRKLMRGGEVNMDAFREFCEKNPQLVRRLRETPIRIGKDEKGEDRIMYLAVTPKAVVDFLRDNEVLPNRFRDDNPAALADRLKQFPVLPPFFYRRAEEELNPERPIGDGEATAMRAARVWFRYANEVIPPPDPEPSFTPQNYRDPERKRRVPRQPMLIIFRQGPPRAQTYVADHLAKEGWFDQDPWVVDESTLGEDRWFRGDVRIKPTANAREEWEIAYTMWSTHGAENGLNISSAKLLDYRRRAELFANKRGFRVGESPGSPPRPDELEDPDMRDSINANVRLQAYAQNLRVTNFEAFLYQAEAEKDPDTIRARKMLYEAEKAYKNLRYSDALAIYEKVLGTQQQRGLWGDVLLRNSRFRTSNDKSVEETYEHQIHYQRLLRQTHQPELRKATLTLFDIVRAAGTPGNASPYHLALSDRVLQTNNVPALNAVEPFWPPGPFDGLDPDNKPWVPEHVKERVRANMGLVKGVGPVPTTPPGAPAGRPPGGPPGPPR